MFARLRAAIAVLRRATIGPPVLGEDIQLAVHRIQQKPLRLVRRGGYGGSLVSSDAHSSDTTMVNNATTAPTPVLHRSRSLAATARLLAFQMRPIPTRPVLIRPSGVGLLIWWALARPCQCFGLAQHRRCP